MRFFAEFILRRFIDEGLRMTGRGLRSFDKLRMSGGDRAQNERNIKANDEKQD